MDFTKIIVAGHCDFCSPASRKIRATVNHDRGTYKNCSKTIWINSTATERKQSAYHLHF